MRQALLVLALALPGACLFAQNQDPAVSISGGPPTRGWSTLYKYTTISSADYIEYICYAPVSQPIARTDVTQIVDSGSVSTVTTAVAHGLSVGNQVTLAGAAGGAAALNTALIVATVGSTTTFTVATSGIADATYSTSGMTYTTTAPRTNANIWSIKRFTYGGTGGTSLVATQWAVKSGGTTSGTGSENACDSRTTLAYQ